MDAGISTGEGSPTGVLGSDGVSEGAAAVELSQVGDCVARAKLAAVLKIAAERACPPLVSVTESAHAAPLPDPPRTTGRHLGRG